LNPCNFYYSATEFFTVPCECSLDGNNTGFCGSVLGTKEYALALSKLKNMYEKSSCHTLDRYSMEAQKEFFIGQGYKDILLNAVTESFKVDHWPYIQDKDSNKKIQFDLNRVKNCFENMSRQSWVNIMLGANRVTAVGMGVSVATMIYSLY